MSIQATSRNAPLKEPAVSETLLPEGSTSSSTVDDVPEDVGNKVWWAHLLIGFALLTPWNTIISTYDYWVIQFPGRNMLFYFTIGITLGV